MMQRGFTLIELLVVVAIIGMLSSVVLSSLNAARGNAGNASRLATINQYLNAAELHLSAVGEYPDPGDTSWHCLGTYADNNCWSGGYSVSSTLNTAWAPYIQVHNGTNNTVSSWEGMLYRCTTRPGNACRGMEIRWFQYGDNSDSCGKGTEIAGSYTNATYCQLIIQ